MIIHCVVISLFFLLSHVSCNLSFDVCACLRSTMYIVVDDDHPIDFDAHERGFTSIDSDLGLNPTACFFYFFRSHVVTFSFQFKSEIKVQTALFAEYKCTFICLILTCVHACARAIANLNINLNKKITITGIRTNYNVKI